MDINKKAEEYAAKKAEESLSKTIAKAYLDGYRDGYNDRSNEIGVDIKEMDTDFVDLGLPSRTLWSTEFLKTENGGIEYMSYDASVRYLAPTREQWEELSSQCEWLYEFFSDEIRIYKVRCVGPNGNEIVFFNSGLFQGTEKADLGSVYFWLNAEQPEDAYFNAVKMKRTSAGTTPLCGMRRVFKGFKLPVRLVKSKD